VARALLSESLQLFAGLACCDDSYVRGNGREERRGSEVLNNGCTEQYEIRVGADLSSSEPYGIHRGRPGRELGDKVSVGQLSTISGTSRIAGRVLCRHY